MRKCFISIVFVFIMLISITPNFSFESEFISGATTNLKWELFLDGYENNVDSSSPAIGSDGTIYIATSIGILYAINPDGTTKWQFIGKMTSNSPSIGIDDTIYIGMGDTFYAINPDGTKKWEFETGGQGISNHAMDFDGTIYVGAGDGKLYALNPDGTKKWEFETGGRFRFPVIGANGIIYVSYYDAFPPYEGYLYSINPDGTKKWEYPLGSWYIHSPAIGSDGTIYVGAGDGKLYALNPDGTKKWEYSVSSINSPPLYSPSIGSDGTIYVGAGDGKLYALNPDGTKKWEYYANSYIPSNPAIGSDNTIYFGCANDKLYALNPDGTKKWEFGPVGDNIESSPAIASDGTIYFLSNDKKLYALESESSWIESDYQTSMQGYANSYWPKFRQNNFNLGRYYTSNLITQSISATPSTLVQGETITITMTISNNRNDTAANISPSNLFHSGTGGISYVSGPSPVSLTIDGHSQETFVWKYTAEINGSVIFTGNASGDNWTLIKPTDSNEVTIQTPASLSSSITASPSTVVQGNTITVTMTVSNSGDSTATTVVPSALGKTGTGSAAFASGPTPSSRTIAGHSEANFTWTYTAGDVGALTFSGNASADGGLSSSSTDSNEVTIYIPNGAPYVIENFDERGVKKSEIVIPYTLYDGESDICSLSVEYYYEGSWLPATEGVGGDGSVGLASSTTGVPHIFVWDSRSDTMQSILHKTKIRIKPNDGLLEGPWTETGIFNVNNKRPDPKVIFGPIATARLKAVKELLAIIEPKLPEISTDEIEKMMDEAYMHIENASNSNDEVYISSELNKAKKLLEKIEKILDSS